MSEISFVSRLGDTLEQTLAPQIVPARTRRRLPRWMSSRMALGLGVLVLGAGAATAATLIDQGTTTLVAGGLECISGTNNDVGPYFATGLQHGDSPTSACATLLSVPAGRLVACAKSAAGVVVYESSGDPDQCQSLGLTPLPADYTAAVGQVHALQQALAADYNKADCVPPQQLAQDADSDLQRLGFAGWHAAIDRSSAATDEYGGPCGQFPALGGSISSPVAALEADHRTVMIEIGASASTLQLAERVVTPAVAASGERCYTLATAQQLVHNMLNTAAGHTVPVKFAVAREQSGPQALLGRQQYYDQGCTVISGIGTASDGQTFLVVLENKTGPAPPIEGSSNQGLALEPQGVPNSDFQPVLTQG